MLRALLFGHRTLAHTLRVLHYLDDANFATLDDLHEDLDEAKLPLWLFLRRLEQFTLIERGEAQHSHETLYCLTARGKRFLADAPDVDSRAPSA